MALPRAKQLQLLLLEKEKRRRQERPKQSQQKPGLKDLLTSAVKQTPLGQIGGLPGQIGNLPSGVRRAALTGAGTAIGETSGPIGAGLGAAAGGTLSDIADASENPDLIKAVQTELSKSGLSATMAKNLAIQASKSMSKDDIVSFFKKRGGEFAVGATLSGISKGITKAVVKASKKSASGSIKTGFAEPVLATKVGQAKAFRSLKNFKRATLKKESIQETQKLRLQITTPGGRQKLINSLETKLTSKSKLSNSELLLGREASRKVAKTGGENGRQASKIFGEIEREMEKRFPGIRQAFKRVEKTVKALKEEGKVSPIGLIDTLKLSSGKASGLKAFLPSFGVKTGATLRKLVQSSAGVGTGSLSSLIKALSDRKRK